MKITKKSLKLISASVLFISLSFVLTGCGQNNDNQEEAVSKKQVRVQEIDRQDKVSSTLSASGTVVPKEYSIIRSLVPGTLEYITPVGLEISKGQSLFSIRDSGIENNYFNAVQNFQQTSVLTGQRIEQAQLAANSAESRLNLAKKNFDIVKKQTNQALTSAQDSALINYRSAYNALDQVFTFLSKGAITNFDFLYKNLTTTNFQLGSDAGSRYYSAAKKFVNLPGQSQKENLENNLNEINEALAETKSLVDTTLVLLQNALDHENFNIEADKTIIASYQVQINQYANAILAAKNSIENIKINNHLSLDQSQGQLDLAQIDYDNALISLKSAQDSAELERTIAKSQMDNASYSYGNLSLNSPFSGIVLSNFVSAGEQVSVGQQIIEIGNLSIVEITVEIDTEFARGLKINDSVVIEDGYEGSIAEIEPAGDINSGKIGITVQSENSGDKLVAGQIASVEFTLNFDRPGVIVIPIKSTVVEQNNTYVFLVEDGKAVKRSITLGEIFGDKVSVTGGLNEGDKIILKNGVFISESEEVEIVN